MNMPLGLIHGVAKDILAVIRRRISKADKVECLRKRQDLKDVFISKLALSPQWPLDYPLEVLLRDIDRIGEYPEDKISKPDRIRPFFKTELLGLYHGGIETYNNVVGLKETVDGLFVEYGGRSGAYQIARTPFDWIDHVDCFGDEFDSTPHIYCRFKNKGTPFQEFRIERMIIREGRVVRTAHLGMLDVKTGKII